MPERSFEKFPEPEQVLLEHGKQNGRVEAAATIKVFLVEKKKEGILTEEEQRIWNYISHILNRDEI